MVAIPYGWVFGCAALAVTAGLLAALGPTRRVARLDVLRAIGQAE
jgi:hypothetical protein